MTLSNTQIDLLTKINSIATDVDFRQQRDEVLTEILSALEVENGMAVLWLYDTGGAKNFQYYTPWNEVALRNGQIVKKTPHKPEHIFNKTYQCTCSSKALPSQNPCSGFLNNIQKMTNEFTAVYQEEIAQLIGTDTYAQKCIPLIGPPLSLNFPPRKQEQKEREKEGTVCIGFIQIITNRPFEKFKFNEFSRIVELWGQAIQAKRKIRAMDSIETFVSETRDCGTGDTLVEKACVTFRQIIKVDRVIACLRNFNQEKMYAECKFDTDKRPNINCQGREYGPLTLVYKMFDKPMRQPSVYIKRIADLTDTDMVKEKFKKINGKLTEQDYHNFDPEQTISAMFVNIAVKMHTPINGLSAQTAAVFQLFSKPNHSNQERHFSDIEEYIIAAASQYIAARLPWLYFKDRLRGMRRVSRETTSLPPLKDDTSFLSRDNRVVNGFLTRMATTIELVSAIFILETDGSHKINNKFDNNNSPIPNVFPYETIISTEIIKTISMVRSTIPRIMIIDGAVLFTGLISESENHHANVGMVLSARYLTSLDWELLEILFTEITTLWTGKRNLGEEKQIMLETGHALNQTMGNVFSNISQAEKIFFMAKERNPQDAYKIMFGSKAMRNMLNDAKAAAKLSEAIFISERVTAGDIKPEDLVREPQDIASLMQLVCRIYNNKSASRNIRIIDVGTYDKTLPTPQLDTSLITVMIMNIIENAVKYAYSDTEIIINYGYKRPGKWFFSVENYGPLIPEYEKRKLLDPFYRAEVVWKERKIMGLGLGLSIVYRILKVHDNLGQFGIISQPLDKNHKWYKEDKITTAMTKFIIAMNIDEEL